MREILDNARYAPTVGRYKVYLIDEVHMLSKAAFNSMLKTLEEPPEHVKFVLATTDPQKIPVTVLSRCLQFNLKPLPPPMIEARLAYILGAEGDRARRGGAGADRARRAGLAARRAVAARPGDRVRRRRSARGRSCARCWARSIAITCIGIVDALIADDGAALLAEADALAARGLALGVGARGARVAVPSHRRRAGRAGRRRRLRRRRARRRVRARAPAGGGRSSPTRSASQGRADLALAPDEATGFAMTLLRMLAFAPAARGCAGAPPARARTRRRLAAPATAPSSARRSPPAARVRADVARRSAAAPAAAADADCTHGDAPRAATRACAAPAPSCRCRRPPSMAGLRRAR